MKSKILNLLLIISSLLGRLEWGGNNQLSLFQAEVDIFSKLFTNPSSVFHPLILLPILGQLLLLFTLFQKKPSKILTYISIGFLGILLLLMFVIGIMGLNYRILLSTLPFLIISFLAIRHYKKMG